MRIELGSTRLNDLHSLGQSVWLDCRLPRTLLGSHLTGFVRAGISGLDTHHTDLGRAYLEDETYRRPMTALRATDATPQQIYERLSTEDFRRAATAWGASIVPAATTATYASSYRSRSHTMSRVLCRRPRGSAG